jgi:asparagine synthetase B (glutamine-hydrolysing)
MCGICGKINLNNEPLDETLLRRMTSCLSLWGPDDEIGNYFSKVKIFINTSKKEGFPNMFPRHNKMME